MALSALFALSALLLLGLDKGSVHPASANVVEVSCFGGDDRSDTGDFSRETRRDMNVILAIRSTEWVSGVRRIGQWEVTK
ncbi:hypothetical protein MUK42_22850 [Musa troglodytarum]|uniref:Uncharacterized protein n=1 Tax=Musa troglodytarum TaxID=320322 RepID=A0A9E7G9H0_9LILI|nr:hypothetical protein MUK42_22850 [Musa troglodytarum]